MKLRKNWKRFWTLNRHHAEGFTLVELIVVIAILAILGGVAVPAYSGYVKKANMGADQTLVSEVAHALTLYHYSNPDAEGGYVVLTLNGASGDGTVGDAAMQAIFGDGWADTAMLKYDGWTDDGLLGYVLANKESAPLIAGSTYLTTASPDGLMSAVTNLTDAASTVIKNYSGDVEGKLQSLLGEDFVNNLKNTGVTSDDEEYETVISNMMVGHFANTLNNSSIEEIQASADGPVQMMLVYAELYAYCETIGDTSTIDSLNTYLASADDMDQLKAGSLYTYLSENDPTFVEGFMAFAGEDEDGNPGQGMKDMEAALEIMGAVGHVAGTHTDKDALSDPNLYASDSVASQLDNYINAINAVANMDTTALGAISDGSVVVFVAEDGAVSVVPGAAYLVS